MLLCHKPKIFDVDLYCLIALFGLAGLGWMFLLRPLDQKNMLAENSQFQYQQAQQTVQLELQQLERVIQSRTARSDQVTHLADLLDQNIDLFEAIRIIGSAANQTTVRLEEIIPGDTTKHGFYQQSIMTLRFTGVFLDVRQFMNQIAQKIPLARCSNLEFSLDQNVPGRCECTLQLDLFTKLET